MTFPVGNKSDAVTLAIPLKTIEGQDVAVVVAKYRYLFSVKDTKFDIDKDVKSNVVDLVDTFNGDDPARASIRRPSLLYDSKPGTDVVVLGHAYARRAGATVTDVRIDVGPISKSLKVYGLRVYRRALTGVAPGPARPIVEPVPVIYELAYGGQDDTNPMRPIGEPRNYVGRGVAADVSRLVDMPAHQIESVRDDGPACLGAIHRHWIPRRGFAGTFGEAWQAHRMPLLPTDFDPRFHVCVPPDQWSPTPLRSDCGISIVGMTEEGTWTPQLPRLAVGFGGTIDGVWRERPGHLETILIDCDAMSVELTYRSSFPLPAKWERLGKMTVIQKDVI